MGNRWTSTAKKRFRCSTWFCLASTHAFGAQGFAGWFETSAKDNVNINEAAEFLVQKIIENDKVAIVAPACWSVFFLIFYFFLFVCLLLQLNVSEAADNSTFKLDGKAEGAPAGKTGCCGGSS